MTVNSWKVRPSQLSQVAQLGPYLVALCWLVAGYLHYAPGADYSLSADHYRAWAFPAFRYSDIIWLYLRDNLGTHPLPYLSYRLEYPPLTGLLSWLLSWAPDLPAYFALAYVVLSGCALLAIWSLQRLSGANPWLFAASPALFLYAGHQWDLAAIAVTALSLVAFQGDRRAASVIGLALATSLKLFPVVFFIALTVESVRDRRRKQAIWETGLFAIVSLLINIPVALANRDGWSFFIRWNRDRLADSGLWVLWRDIPTADLTRWSMVAAVAGGATLTLLAIRRGGPIAIPLGATYLVWWLLVNKTFTTHLILWVFLALALVSAPLWIWVLTTVVDIVAFQLGNYLNLYNVDSYRHTSLIRKAVENIYDPVQIARTAVLGAVAIWLIQVVANPRRRSTFATGTRHSLPPPEPRYCAILPVASTTTREKHLGIGAALVVFTVATLLMTWPYAAQARSSTIVGFDPFLQIWLSEWIQHALTANPAGLYAANMFYPFEQTLAYTDANLPGALLAFPIRALTGDPILTNSILVLGSFVLASMGVYLLVRAVTGNPWVALVAGLAYGFLPYRMVHLWHLNWLEGALLPWYILVLVRLFDRPSVGNALVAGVLAAGITLVSFYFAPQLLLISVTLVTGAWVSRRGWPDRHFWRLAAIAGLLALALATPLLLPYLQVHQQQRLERTIADVEQYKALPISYAQLAPWDTPNTLQRALGIRAAPNESLTEVGQARHADSHQHAEIVSEDALYPGMLVLAFAGIGVICGRPRWFVVSMLTVSAIAAVLSLGPSWGPRHDVNPLLPYTWLYENVPFFRAMRVPARLGGLVGLALVLLAATGMHASWQFLRPHIRIGNRLTAGTALTALAAAFVVADLWTGPVPVESVDRSPESMSGAVWLATQPPGPVMEFPAESIFADPAAASVRRHTGEALLRSTIHWQPMVNGNSGFIPRSYSDFIERFVSELPRDNGTTTESVSHLDAETIHLLQQIGVRYVVFNVDQYASDDWPAVERELEELVHLGQMEPAGTRGRQQIYVITPTQPRVPAAQISLFAPTLMTPGDSWSPWIGIEAPRTPSTLALTRPPQLTLSWYSAEGQLLHRDHDVLALPAVMEDQTLLCSVTECLTSRSVTDVRQLPRPDRTGGWTPGEPGHYVIRAELTGEIPLTCEIDLDIVEDLETVSERGGDDPYRWAACIEDAHYPVNNPGLPPFGQAATEVAVAGNTIGVEFTIVARNDELLRAWFILSPRGLPQPWRVASFQSTTLQQVARAREPVKFAWNDALAGSLPPGAYDLTVWVHYQAGGAWKHATGGRAIADAIVVDANGELRRAGPIKIGMRDQLTTLHREEATVLPLQFTGSRNRDECEVRWKLEYVAGKTALEGVADCEAVSVTVPSTVAVGNYRLTTNVYETGILGEQLSDGITTAVTVSDAPDARSS